MHLEYQHILKQFKRSFVYASIYVHVAKLQPVIRAWTTTRLAMLL